MDASLAQAWDARLYLADVPRAQAVEEAVPEVVAVRAAHATPERDVGNYDPTTLAFDYRASMGKNWR